MMKLLMIAVVRRSKSNKSIEGFRIFDINNKKYMNVPMDSVKQVLLDGKASVDNLGLIRGEVVGTNGVLDRYPIIDLKGQLIGDMSPLVIINQIGTVGYTVVDYKGCVKRARALDIVEYAKKEGIANGKVVSKDNIEYISSITGTYDIENVPEGTMKSGGESIISVGISNKSRKGKSKLEKDTEVDVDVTIDETDVFNIMTENQKNVLKDYYIWYTVDQYKAMAKSIRFDIAPGKAEVLARIRGEHEWEFAGAWDTGFKGADQCTLKHPLRYVYYAAPTDSRQDRDTWIKFGSTCAADFFSISKEDMTKLQKTMNMVTSEIELMSDVLTNKEENDYILKAEMLYDIIRRLGDKDRIFKMFGGKVGRTLIQFIAVGLPFPMSLVIEAANQIRKDRKGFFMELFPDYEVAIDEILLSYNSTYVVSGARMYLDFILDNKIEGKYGYNPLDRDQKERRDIGRYNKDTRNERYSFLRGLRLRVLCDEFNLQEVENLLFSLDKLIKSKDYIVSELGDIEEDASKHRKFAERFIGNGHEFEEDQVLRSVIFNSLMVCDVCSRDGYGRFRKFSEQYGTTDYLSIKEVRYDIERLALNQGRLNSLIRQYEHFSDDWKKKLEEAERELAKMYEEDSKEAVEDKDEDKDNGSGAVEEKKDKLEILQNLMEKYPDVEEDYGVKVAKDIIKKEKSYKRLSSRQKWRIDNTIDIYMGRAGHKQEEKQEIQENKRYLLSEHKDIERKVNKIIKKSDDDDMQKVLKEVPNAIKIAQTINRYKRASDKQMKHINKAIEMLESM